MKKKFSRSIAALGIAIVAVAGTAFATLLTGHYDWIVIGSDSLTGYSNVITFVQASSGVQFVEDGSVSASSLLGLSSTDFGSHSTDDTNITAGDHLHLGGAGIGTYSSNDTTFTTEDEMQLNCDELNVSATDDIDLNTTGFGSSISLYSAGGTYISAENGIWSQTSTGYLYVNLQDPVEGEDQEVTQIIAMIPDSELAEGEWPEVITNANILTTQGNLRAGTVAVSAEDSALNATLYAEESGDISIESGEYSSTVSNRSSVTCEKNGDVVIQLGGES